MTTLAFGKFVGHIHECRREAGVVKKIAVSMQKNEFGKDPNKVWRKSELSPMALLAVFPLVETNEGHVLRAYLDYRRQDAGVVYAMRASDPFPEPSECMVTLQDGRQGSINVPKPPEAMEHIMMAIKPIRSFEDRRELLVASVLCRELLEFGAWWHGIEWGAETILKTPPWADHGINERRFSACRLPTQSVNAIWKETDWKITMQPEEWGPHAISDPNRTVIIFHTYTERYGCKIIRYADEYMPETGLVPRTSVEVIGTAPGGYMP